jgi:hypothetical protein
MKLAALMHPFVDVLLTGQLPQAVSWNDSSTKSIASRHEETLEHVLRTLCRF